MKFRAALRAPRGGPLRQHSCRKEGRCELREASPTRYGTEYRGGFGRPRREPERPEPRAPRSGRGEGWPGASAKRETEGATKETAPIPPHQQATRRRNPKGRSTFQLSQSFLRLQSKWTCAAGRLF